MASSMLNSISISVSDDDSDDIAGRMRVRKKRKRLGFGSRSDAARRIFRMISRYWPFLIFVPAIVILLFFDLPSIGSKPEVKLGRDLAPEKKKIPSVRTRIVNGVRERKLLTYLRCLYIFHPLQICRVFMDIMQGVSVFFLLEKLLLYFFYCISVWRVLKLKMWARVLFLLPSPFDYDKYYIGKS